MSQAFALGKVGLDDHIPQIQMSPRASGCPPPSGTTVSKTFYLPLSAKVRFVD